LKDEPEACLFLPQAQQPGGWVLLLVRVNGNPATAIAFIKEQIHSVAPHQGIAEIETMENVMADSIARPKLEVTVLSAFGLVVLILACVGIYAVISYSVEQRTREMGIRLARAQRRVPSPAWFCGKG
jgi:putative ABC transport system permease protein